MNDCSTIINSYTQETKNNYNKLIKEANEHMININIYENIIKLTGAKGIPRQIINGKLQYVENEVNNIINPFINKQIKKSLLLILKQKYY